MQIITARYGRPAYEELTVQVRKAKEGDPLREVLLIVPTELVKVSARRWLAAQGPAGGPGVAGLSIVSLYRLAESIAGPAAAGQGRKPITTPVMLAAMRSLAACEGGLFTDVADHPQTARALVEASRSLRDVDPDLLPALAASDPLTGEVVRLHEAALAKLAGQYYDEAGLLAEASATVNSLPAVVMFLPVNLSAAQTRFLTAIDSVTPVTAIIGLSGTHADGSVLESVGAPPAVESETPLRIADRVICATDADDEVRAAIAVVADKLKGGLPGHRIGIVYPSAVPYARILHEQLGDAGIEAFGRGVRPAAELMYGRAVRTLLSLPARDFRRAEVIAFLSDAPVAGVSATRSDRVSRKAGVLAGDDWSTRLAALSQTLRQQAEDSDDDSRSQRYASEADDAEHLRLWVEDLRNELSAMEGADSWAVLVDRFLAAWFELFPEPLGDPNEARVHADIARIAEGLRGLDDIAGSPSLSALREILDLELRFTTNRVGKIGTGVMTGTVADAAGQQFDLLCILGLAEGAFPPPWKDDPLLPERVREKSSGGLPGWRERQDRMYRDLQAAMAGATECVLLFPRGDLRSATTRVPSRWLLPSLQHHLHADVQATTWREWNSPAVEVRGSYAESLMRSDPVNAPQLRQVLALANPEIIDATAREVIAAREELVFNRFNGLVGSEPPLPPIANSPTALESWFTCPRHHFQKHVLGMRELDDPDDTIEMSPADRGTLQHAVLERLVTEWSAAGFGEPWPDELVARLDELIDEEFARAEATAVVGLKHSWNRQKIRMRSDLRHWILRDNKLRADGWKPLRAELRFRDLELRLPSGEVFHVNGSIDRVDTDRHSNLRVWDYKTGQSRNFSRLKQDNPTASGRFLQLPIYAIAAETSFGRGPLPTQAKYWFLSGGSRDKPIGYAVTDEVKERALSVVEVVLDGYRRGIFPPRPKVHSHLYDCPSCQPDGADRLTKEGFELLLQADELADYRAVIDE